MDWLSWNTKGLLDWLMWDGKAKYTGYGGTEAKWAGRCGPSARVEEVKTGHGRGSMDWS